jgi:hypothetical protein
MHLTHPAPALTFRGDVALPHYSARLLSPSREKTARNREISWLEKGEEGFTLRIEETGLEGGPVDYLIWFPASMPPLYMQPPDERGYWIRSAGGDVLEVIFSNTREVRFERDGIFLEISFSAPAEGYLLRKGDLWTLYLDRFLDESVALQWCRIRDVGGVERALVMSGGERSMLPGREYRLTASP